MRRKGAAQVTAEEKLQIVLAGLKAAAQLRQGIPADKVCAISTTTAAHW
ncbi:MAG: hypothetical protein ACYCOU_12970 [Sulfobacillus sp.]